MIAGSVADFRCISSSPHGMARSSRKLDLARGRANRNDSRSRIKANFGIFPTVTRSKGNLV